MLRIGFAGMTAAAYRQRVRRAGAGTAAGTAAVRDHEVTDNVYIFRYGGHQSMFIVTPAGVIATDPISERRPAATAYIDEIRKITQAPIKYVIYSHSHFDHIAGGKPFKDLGATFVAQSNAKARIARTQAGRCRRPGPGGRRQRRRSASAAPRSNSTISARIIPTAR